MVEAVYSIKNVRKEIVAMKVKYNVVERHFIKLVAV